MAIEEIEQELKDTTDESESAGGPLLAYAAKRAGEYNEDGFKLDASGSSTDNGNYVNINSKDVSDEMQGLRPYSSSVEGRWVCAIALKVCYTLNILQWIRDCTEICCVNAAFTQRLRSDCAAIAQRLRSDCAAIVQRLCSVCAVNT
jgi:hypothetical protein